MVARHLVLLADAPAVRARLLEWRLAAWSAPIERGAGALGLWGEWPAAFPDGAAHGGALAIDARMGALRAALVETFEWALASRLSSALETAAAVFVADAGVASGAGVFERGALVAFRGGDFELGPDGDLAGTSHALAAAVDGLLGAVVAVDEPKGLARFISLDAFARRAPLVDAAEVAGG